jgi:hypothetical protein
MRQLTRWLVKADEYRAKARTAAAMAAAANDPEMKRQLEDLARQWDQLAKRAERVGRHGW